MSELRAPCPHCDGVIGISYDAERRVLILRPLDVQDPPPPAAAAVNPKTDAGILDGLFGEGQEKIPDDSKKT